MSPLQVRATRSSRLSERLLRSRSPGRPKPKGHLDFRHLYQPIRKPNFKLMETREAPRPEVSVFDLVKAVGTILQRIEDKEGQTREIQADTWSVSQKIEMFRKRAQTQKRFKFSELFEDDRTRQEVVVTFLALLEMIRMKQLQAVQPSPFEEIEIQSAQASDEQASNPEDAAHEEEASGQVQNPSS